MLQIDYSTKPSNTTHRLQSNVKFQTQQTLEMYSRVEIAGLVIGWTYLVISWSVLAISSMLHIKLAFAQLKGKF
jgi:hypothetical protein